MRLYRDVSTALTWLSPYPALRGRLGIRNGTMPWLRETSVVSRIRFDNGMLQGPPHPRAPRSPRRPRSGWILLPSPLWRRGWRASGVIASRGGPGEGVSPIVNSYVGHYTRLGHAGGLNSLTRTSHTKVQSKRHFHGGPRRGPMSLAVGETHRNDVHRRMTNPAGVEYRQPLLQEVRPLRGRGLGWSDSQSVGFTHGY
jgi:hypothetical protein